MLTPIEIFQNEGKLEDPNELFKTAQATINADLGSNQRARAFLLTQATLLCKNGCEALVLTEELSTSGIGVYDREVKKLSIIAEPTASMSSTLSHEMTHGIEHLFSHNSEENVMNMLHGASKDMAQIIVLASETLPLDMQGQFRRQIQDDRSKTPSQKLSEELGAYMVEGFFNDIHSKPHTERKNFSDRYNSLLEPKGRDKRRGFTEEELKLRKKVQGLIAVSMFEANQVILRNLPEDSELHPELLAIQATLQPAYTQVQEKYREAWSGLATTSNPPATEEQTAHTSSNMANSDQNTSQAQQTMTSPITSGISSTQMHVGTTVSSQAEEENKKRSGSPTNPQQQENKRLCAADPKLLAASLTIAAAIPPGLIEAASNNGAPTSTPTSHIPDAHHNTGQTKDQTKE